MKKGSNAFKWLFIALPTLILLSSCDEGAISQLTKDLEAIKGSLIPNIWAFLVQLLALIVMNLVVIFVAYKPVKKFIQARKDYLNNERDETARLNAEAKENIVVAEREKNEAKSKANEIIKEAEVKANVRRDEIVAEAQKEAGDIKEKTAKEIELAKKKALSELSGEIVGVALDASEKILEREVNEEDNKKIVDDFLKDLNN